MIKASKPENAKPFQYETGAAERAMAKSLIFVGNINGTPSEWARHGSAFTRLDVLGVSSRRFSSRTVGRGFSPGDAFVEHGTGDGRVIDRGTNGRGMQLYVLRPMKPPERQGLSRGIRTAERELRWRRGSYCEDEKRKGRKT
jgi:hypothetical protein